MRKSIGLASMGALILGLGVALPGCSDEAESRSEQVIKGPDGQTKVTKEIKVEKSGDNPPPVTKTP